MKCGDGTAVASVREPLVQAVKEIRQPGRAFPDQNPAGCVAGHGKSKAAQKAVRAKTEQEAALRMGLRESEQHLAAVYSHAGQLISDAVSGV